jgi:hypothetical protein
MIVWFSPRTLVSSNKTNLHDLTEILLKVALNTIALTPITTKVVSSNPVQHYVINGVTGQ